MFCFMFKSFKNCQFFYLSQKNSYHKIYLLLFLLLNCKVCLRPTHAFTNYADSYSSTAEYDSDSGEVSDESPKITKQQNSVPNFANETTTSQPHLFEQSHTPDDNDDEDDEKNPSAIQKAVCTITAGEVRASAEAVTTKTLKGVCGSAELQLAFSNLESKIFKELEEIKALLMLQQQQKVIETPQENLNFNEVVTMPTSTPTSTPRPTPTTMLTSMPTATKKPPPIFEIPTKKTSQNLQNFNSVDSKTNFSISPKLKSLQQAAHQLINQSTNQHHYHQHQQRPSSSSSSPSSSSLSSIREKEVSKFNNTMLTDKDFKVFTYYWRLENFTKRIENEISSTLDSPRFSIKGKPLHLKAYFQHLHRDFLYLQLEYATSSSNGIMLDMGLLGGSNGGTLFKAISSNDKIMFKYKIKILDQQNMRSSKDLVSQEFHNLDGGFLVPNSALLASPFVKNDTLLVQLFLYL